MPNIMRLISLALLVSTLLIGNANAQDLHRWYQVKGGAWQVPSETIKDIAATIQGAANRHANEHGKGARSIALDTFQYQGVKTGASRQVLVRGACNVVESTPSKLTSRWYMVLDGGDCYFEAIYDPKQKQFLRFSFNGVA